MSIHRGDDGSPNVFTYLFTDNSGNRIADLPIRDVSFSLVLNGSGQFTGTLNVGDPRVQALAWINATAPNLAQVWVDINGSLVYGGRVTNRKYDRTAGTVTIQALDHMSYLQQRLQAQDYSTNWATTATGAAQIAHTIIADALAVSGSLGISLSTPAATPSQYAITLTAPRQQRMTIDALCNMMSGLGWQVGFDYATDVAYVAGVPTATLTLSYPRRGRIAGTTGLVLDASQSLAFVHTEDGTQQANSVAQTATGGGGVSTVGIYEPAISVDGYPLLEKLAMHTSFTATKTPASVMAAFAADDLALAAYPVVTPQITMPMFAEPAIGEWIIGDDVRVTLPMTKGGGPSADPRFPNGLDFFFRLTRSDCQVPNEGVATTAYTFNLPPSSTPQRPPH